MMRTPALLLAVALAALLSLLLAPTAQPAPVELSERERAWLREAPVVIVGAQIDYPPFDFTDRTGKASGYANELFRLAADKVGLRYRFVTGLEWEQLLQRAREGRIDVLTCLWVSPARRGYLRFIEPAYGRHVVGLATRRDDPDPPARDALAGERIAIVEGFSINDQLRARYPRAQFVEVRAPVEALRAVAFGRADGYIDHVSLIEHLRAEHGFANLHVGDQFELQGTEYYMAVARDLPVLHGILGKALAAVDEEEIRALQQRWLRPPSEAPGLRDWIEPYLLPMLAALLATATAIALLSLWNRRLAREVALRRRAEAQAHERSVELTRHLHLQQSLLDAAPTAIVAVDDQGRYTLFNAAAERLFGHPASAFLGKPAPSPGHEGEGYAPWLADAGAYRDLARNLGELTGEEVAPDWRAFRLAAALKLPPGEIEMLHRDGSRVPLWLALGATYDENDRLYGIVAVAVDLSATKRLERELRESEARAQAASDAKSSFLAAMSHEIRTPMIGVTGMIEVLAHSRLDADQRRALNIAQQSSQTLLQVLGDILDFSKIEADRLQLEPVALDLRRLVRGTVANYSGAASSKGLNLDCEIDPRVAPAHRGDALRLRQILGNFLSNAIKFTERGSVRVQLQAQPPEAGEDGERQPLQLRVIDTGIGVDPAQQIRLFEPFSQAEPGRRYGGTGLGLAICRRLAALMDGELTMDSAPGRGTTLSLRISLPLADPAEVRAEPAGTGVGGRFRPRQLPSVEAALAERSLVLVVDDHPTNRLVIARQLALAGYASESAADGDQALQRWRSGRYALLLSDVHMPGLDGYRLAHVIREEEAARGLPHTPIVALTAAALKGEAERCLEAGMDDYLAKPVAVAELAACLQRWLPHTAQAASEDEARPDLPQLGEPPALDEAVLAQYGPAAAQRELLDDYLTSTAQDLGALDTARDSGDAFAIARQAHKIKGAAGLVGAVELGATAAALETAARRGDWRPLPPLIADLHTAAQRLRLVIADRYPAVV